MSSRSERGKTGTSQKRKRFVEAVVSTEDGHGDGGAAAASIASISRRPSFSVSCADSREVVEEPSSQTRHLVQTLLLLSSKSNEVLTKLLRGKRLAISTRIESDTTTDEELSYNQLSALCSKLGAEISSQVHKKVHVVIASMEAVKTPATQRVRKAWKLHIPVVRVEWIQKCILAKELVPMDSRFCVLPPLCTTNDKEETTAAQPSSKKKKRLKTSQSSNEHNEGKEACDVMFHTVAKCYCICHDLAEEKGAEIKNCPWCINCSVNSSKTAE